MPIPRLVTLHPAGFSCHLRVQGSRNVRRVRRRLDSAGVASEGPVHRDGTSTYVLSVPYGRGVTHSRLERLMKGVTGFSFYS